MRPCYRGCYSPMSGTPLECYAGEIGMVTDYGEGHVSIRIKPVGYTHHLVIYTTDQFVARV